MESLWIKWLLQSFRCPFDGNWGATDGRTERAVWEEETPFIGWRLNVLPHPCALFKNVDQISVGNLLSYHEKSSPRTGPAFWIASHRVKSEANKILFSFIICATERGCGFFYYYSCFVFRRSQVQISGRFGLWFILRSWRFCEHTEENLRPIKNNKFIGLS